MLERLAAAVEFIAGKGNVARDNFPFFDYSLNCGTAVVSAAYCAARDVVSIVGRRRSGNPEFDSVAETNPCSISDLRASAD